MRSGEIDARIPCRVFSVSFSGELSYEINVPAGFASALFQRVMERGASLGITPYGLEALDVLRIEKGHLAVGTEIDGRTTPQDLGLARMVSTRKGFIGSIGQEPRKTARAPGSIAVALDGLSQGVQIIRVHDVAETAQALRLWAAVR